MLSLPLLALLVALVLMVRGLTVPLVLLHVVFQHPSHLVDLLLRIQATAWQQQQQHPVLNV